MGVVAVAKWPYIAGDYLVGKEDGAFAVVTCGSHDLPEKVVTRAADIVAIAGSCETENDGVARILQNIVSNSNIRFLVICGEEVVGHAPGQTIIALYENGIGANYRVIGSEGTIPVLNPKYFRIGDPHTVVERFRKQVTLVDMRGERDPDVVVTKIRSLAATRVERYPEPPLLPLPEEEKYDWATALRRVVEEGSWLRERGAEPVNVLFYRGELKVCDVAGIKLGGQRGEYPIVLSGTLFYRRDPLVEDPFRGVFNEEAAEELIVRQMELSDEYSLPSMVHVVGETGEALSKYLFFVADVADTPVIIDSTSLEARVEAMKAAKEAGLEHRTIYNSVLSAEERELEALRAIAPVEYAIILAYGFTLEERLKKVKTILAGVQGVVENAILDPGVPILGEGGIEALHAAWTMKRLYGNPAAIGIHNLVAGVPHELKQKMDFTFIYALPSIYGLDLSLYGPIRNAPRIFPLVAAVEAAVADELHNALGILPRPVHPYYKVREAR
ncbi:MAG: hypothetical protein KIH01_04505 [Candidatus Freyarchaeota archaeon]|nr:hypothetical protein [Candidatus Jordarchaeia archaeon]